MLNASCLGGENSPGCLSVPIVCFKLPPIDFAYWVYANKLYYLLWRLMGDWFVEFMDSAPFRKSFNFSWSYTISYLLYGGYILTRIRLSNLNLLVGLSVLYSGPDLFIYMTYGRRLDCYLICLVSKMISFIFPKSFDKFGGAALPRFWSLLVWEMLTLNLKL